MKYNPEDPKDSPKEMKAEIRHITLLKEGRYRGQYLVGFSIDIESTDNKLKKT